MILKLSELRVVAFAKVVKRLLWLCGYWVPKTYFSQLNQVAITLSSLAKDVLKVPGFTFMLQIHPQANCCSESFFGNSLSKLCLGH